MDVRQREDRLLRVKQIVPNMIHISKAAFWAGVKKGTFPPGRKLSPRVTVFRKSQIDAVIEGRDWRDVD